MSASKCRHCGVRIEAGAPGFWIHITHLNRCQDHNVPYGCEAHPVGTACPDHCLGSRQDVGS